VVPEFAARDLAAGGAEHEHRAPAPRTRARLVRERRRGQIRWRWHCGFLALFLVWPTATVIYVAFTEEGRCAFTLVNFFDFFAPICFCARSGIRSVSAMAVAGASVLALPLAYITSRFAFAARC
jgi:hypothetical protein